MAGTIASYVNPIDVAREMERRGIALYRRAERIVSDDRQRTLLRRLLDEEESHLRYFESISGGSERTDEASPSLAAAMAADAYIPGGLMQLAEEGAFSSMGRMLDSAIQAERASIEYYEGMLSGLTDAPDGLGRRLSEILRQERAHLAELTSWR